MRLLGCVLLFGVLAAPAAANTITVKQRARATYMRLDAAFKVTPPVGCPAREPAATDAAAFDRWYAPRCADLRQQHAELGVSVRHDGHVVYEDDADGYQGAWTGRLYLWEIDKGGCSPGWYYWRVVLRDPWARRGESKGASGRFHTVCS